MTSLPSPSARISVIVPMFNAGATVGETLDSLQSQTVRDWEAVIVDDGSTDEGPAVARARADADPRITVLRQPNRGLSAARNAGIEAARAPWLNFLDSDDWMLERGLETLLELGATSPHGLACAATRWRDAHGIDLNYSFTPGSATVTHADLCSVNRFQVHAAIVARSALEHHRFDESLTALEDWDLWLRLTAGGATWKASPAAVAAYRLRPSSMSRNPGWMFDAASTVLDRHTRSDDPCARRTRARFAVEHAAAWIHAGTTELARVRLCNAPWLGGEHAPTLDSSVVAGALGWRVPFLACLPPCAWRDEKHAPALVAAARRVLDALTAWGRLNSDDHPEVIASIARSSVDNAAVARWIADRCVGARVVALHGLGRNAAVLAPVLAAAGHHLIGRDDASAPSAITDLGGVKVRVENPFPWAAVDTHVVCPTIAPKLEASLTGTASRGARVIKWADATADISGADHQRLERLWACASVEPRAEMFA
ncbi:MAG: glycosyltransferase family 2 protein [Phycisphaerales bacterium]